MTKQNNTSSILEGKKNKNNNKVQRLKIFDANSTSGYGYYSVNQDGVLHGCMESFSGTDQTHKNTAVETLINQMKEAMAVYGGHKVSTYEVMVYRAMSLLIDTKKNATIQHTVDLGCRPGQNRSMIADMVISKNKYKMLVEVHGGQSRDGNISLWHPKKKATDKYKEDNYSNMGFNAYHVVNIYDNPSADDRATDRTAIEVYHGHAKKRIFIHILRREVLLAEVIGICNRLELDKVMKFNNRTIMQAVNQAWGEMFDYLAERRIARYQLTNI